MFDKLGLQLYTVRDYLNSEEDMDKSFERLVSMGYTVAQSAGHESEAMARLAKKHGITIAGTHYNLDKIVNEPDETMRLHELLGTTNIGIGAMPTEGRETQEGLEKFIKRYNSVAPIYAKNGFRLTYHHHSFEFASHDGKKTMMEYLIQDFDPSISFVLDTCWAANAGVDVCDMIESLRGRLDILHLKDIKTEMIDSWANKQVMCEIGKGVINWEKVIKTAESNDVKYYVVEQDTFWSDNDPFKSLEISKEYLKKFIK